MPEGRFHGATLELCRVLQNYVYLCVRVYLCGQGVASCSIHRCGLCSGRTGGNGQDLLGRSNYILDPTPPTHPRLLSLAAED